MLRPQQGTHRAERRRQLWTKLQTTSLKQAHRTHAKPTARMENPSVAWRTSQAAWALKPHFFAFFFRLAGPFLVLHFSPFHHCIPSFSADDLLPGGFFSTSTSMGPIRAMVFTREGTLKPFAAVNFSSWSSQARSTNITAFPSAIAMQESCSNLSAAPANDAFFFFDFFCFFGSTTSSTGLLRTSPLSCTHGKRTNNRRTRQSAATRRP